MIIITGGAGLIGSNLLKSLNKDGVEDILIVDNLNHQKKIQNISNQNFIDYFQKNYFINLFNKSSTPFKKIKAIFHLGACTNTSEKNGDYLYENNYLYSKKLFKFSINNKIPFIYASSASVYGVGKKGFKENIDCESPINNYAFSKFLFDKYVERHKKKIKSQIVGLRYFNVFGPGEGHKINMFSAPYKFFKQCQNTNRIDLFKGTDGYKNGDQERDFIYVNDCVNIKKWFLENKKFSGIFNVGTGKTTSFNDLANFTFKYLKKKNNIQYIEVPEILKDIYQSYTKADISKYNLINKNFRFTNTINGLKKYYDFLIKN